MKPGEERGRLLVVMKTAMILSASTGDDLSVQRIPLECNGGKFKVKLKNSLGFRYFVRQTEY